MNDVSNTALLTLKCHFQDAMNRDSILCDASSLKTYNYLNACLNEAGKKLLNRKVSKSLVKHTALRARKYDAYVVNFLEKNPEGIIINIGCGLDYRFERIDNGKCLFFDIDLPDIMDLKKEIFPAAERYKQFGQSVFDFSWFEEIPDKPIMLLAEGVFMYCTEKDVKALFNEVHEKLPGSEMVFEVFSSKWLKGWRKKMTDFKLQKQLKFGKDASYKFGIADSDEIESWSEHYKLIDDWSYFDSIRQNTRDALRKIQWTVHYKIQ